MQQLEYSSVISYTLEDIDITSLEAFVDYNINLALGYGNFNFIDIQGRIDLFSSGNTNLDKTIHYINNSEFTVDEQIFLVNCFTDNTTHEYDTLNYFLYEMSVEDLEWGDFALALKLVEYVTKTEIEIELRLQKLKNFIAILNIATTKNNEMLSEYSPEYLKKIARFLDVRLKSYHKTIQENLSEYIKTLSVQNGNEANPIILVGSEKKPIWLTVLYFLSQIKFEYIDSIGSDNFQIDGKKFNGSNASKELVKLGLGLTVKQTRPILTSSWPHDKGMVSTNSSIWVRSHHKVLKKFSNTQFDNQWLRGEIENVLN
jgi:hypothetical protein